MNKVILIAIIASSLLISVHADCDANTHAAGTAGVKTMDATNTQCVTHCQQGYKLDKAAVTTGASAVCAPCAAGTTAGTAAAGSTATSCDNCAVGHYCLAGAATGTTTNVAPTPCADADTWAAAGMSTATGATGCQAKTGAGITGCKVYTTAAADTCAVTKAGYVALSYGSPSATVVACLANCAVCTAGDFAGCTTAAAGYFKDTSAIVACIAGCSTCTGATAQLCTAAKAGFFLDTTVADAKKVTACEMGCKTCTYEATHAKKNHCTATLAGYKIVANQPVVCEAGKGSADGNATADCTACTAAKNCATCSTVDLCKTCANKFTFDAAASTCTAFDQTKKHPSCGDASGDKVDNCQSCDAAHFRELEWDTSVTPAVYKTVGKCNCKPMYYDKSGATPADYICGKCPDNAASCTWTAAGGVDNVKCATGFTLAGKLICAKPEAASTPTGFALDTSVTPAVFKACFASCTACTGVLATQCTACADKDAKYVAPTSTDAAYAQAFAGAKRGLINNTCFDACPAGFAADSARTGCVAASSSSTGVFAIFALIASLFIIF